MRTPRRASSSSNGWRSKGSFCMMRPVATRSQQRTKLYLNLFAIQCQLEIGGRPEANGWLVVYSASYPQVVFKNPIPAGAGFALPLCRGHLFQNSQIIYTAVTASLAPRASTGYSVLRVRRGGPCEPSNRRRWSSFSRRFRARRRPLLWEFSPFPRHFCGLDTRSGL